MISSKRLASAVGGKTARACDSCIRKRARWYCAADDAFLCQACDSSVHSANPLARRHERVRLKFASFKSSLDKSLFASSAPTWHRGFTRKARTPRNGKHVTRRLPKTEERTAGNPFPIVPEVGADENSHEENEEEQLLHRVPIFDPFGSELRTSNEAAARAANCRNADRACGDRSETDVVLGAYRHEVDKLQEFLPSEMDLAEFAADVDSLLGRGLDNECCFGMEGLGLMDSKENKLENDSPPGSGRVKLEDEEDTKAGAMAAEAEIDMTRESFEFNFEDYDDNPASCGEQDEKTVVGAVAMLKKGDEDMDYGKMTVKKKRKVSLSLDCEAVIKAWGSQGSPWATGELPDFDIDDRWPDYTGTCGGVDIQQSYGFLSGFGAGHPAAMGDGGREARVSRYREKRRTRLFSKKIRYEVRKLNAEKRPRMKGRFVKRAPFGGPALSLLNK